VAVDVRAVTSEMPVVGGDDAAWGHGASLMGGGADHGIVVTRLTVGTTTVWFGKGITDCEPFMIPWSVGPIHSWGIKRKGFVHGDSVGEEGV
jgi:hypothetical protein